MPRLLLESGDRLLLESGSADDLLLEVTATPVDETRFQYFELWSALACEGGIRLGQFLALSSRLRRVTGDDVLTVSVPKTNRLADLFGQGKVVREVLSDDGAAVREWPIDKAPSRASGREPLIVVDCVNVLSKLNHYPITLTDGDGVVYQDRPAVQLAPPDIIRDAILGEAPSWIVPGTILPTEKIDVAFSGENARQGTRRLEEACPGFETSLLMQGDSEYGLNLHRIGADADPLYVYTGKNLRSLRKEGLPGRITRINQVRGADGDDGPSTIAWAFWEVEATSGAGPYRVKLKAPHGGPGPIAFDDQLNHANLPGGANSLYIQLANGSYRQITGSWVATQEIQVASLTNVTVGDWVRVVASSTGKQLTFLDAPAEMAEVGLLAGKYESAWDDAVCVVKNPLMEVYPGSGLPTGWTGVGSKTTTANDWLTSGAAVSINQSVSSGAQVLAPPVRSWYIHPRKTTYSAAAWIRLRAAMSGSIQFRVKVGSTVIGTGLTYQSPYGPWQQLKIEGMDLSAYAGTVVNLTLEIVKVGTGTVNMLVDSMCLFPSITLKGVTSGANATRTWQGMNAFLDVQRVEQMALHLGLADLRRMGREERPVVLGGEVVIEDDELGRFQARVMEIRDRPEDPRDTQVVISTLPTRMSRAASKPLALTIPFFESVAVKAAQQDTRNAALLLKATVTASDDTTVTVTLDVRDSLGGSPTVLYSAFWAVYASGSGAGPYVFTKPAAGAGQGRVVFTAFLQGRNDVFDAVDVPEQAGVGASLVLDVTEGDTSSSIAYTKTGTLTLKIDGGSESAAPSSPISVSRNPEGGSAKQYRFKCVNNGQEISETVVIPARAAVPATTPRIANFTATTPDTGTDLVTASWIGVNEPGGVTYDLTSAALITDPATAIQTTEGATAEGVTSPVSDPFGIADYVTKGTSGWKYVDLTLTLRMLNASNVVVATATTTVSGYTT